MTRINLVDPKTLSRNHLIAEYRELPSVFGKVRRAQEKGLTPADIDAPATYVLGPGHVKFFYSRLSWLDDRFLTLVAEMKARGYAPTFETVDDKTRDLHPMWFGTWTPSPEEIAISQARINERLGSGMTYKNKPKSAKHDLQSVSSPPGRNQGSRADWRR